MIDGDDFDWRTARIVAAACRHGGVVYTLVPPARHHDVLHWMQQCGVKQDGTTEQGFLTDTGCFVHRRPARLIAENAGQMIRPKEGGYQGPELFSEDVW